MNSSAQNGMSGDSVFEDARNSVEPILQSFGFVVASETYMPEAFGSGSVEYKRRGMRIELVWDGKDRWVWLKVNRTGGGLFALPGTWADLESDGGFEAKAVGRLNPGELAERRIAELAAHLQSFLTAARDGGGTHG